MNVIYSYTAIKIGDAKICSVTCASPQKVEISPLAKYYKQNCRSIIL